MSQIAIDIFFGGGGGGCKIHHHLEDCLVRVTEVNEQGMKNLIKL